jgi:hypothetical protein
MNRRDSLKAISLTTLSTALLLDACKPNTDKAAAVTDAAKVEQTAGLQDFEIARFKKLNSEKFFTDHEMSTITLLADLIIPKDAVSGSASDAKVPEFIEFIVKDIPEHQVPMRGGLKWLDVQCLNRYGTAFKACTSEQQMEMATAIAYPGKAAPEMQQGVVFFNRVRNLTASGFYTSEIGFKDLGYIGNAPNKWEGVPDDVLKQYNLKGV